MTIDRRALLLAAKARLATVTHATHCVGEPDETLPVISSSDGRVQPYTVLYPGTGGPSLEQNLADNTVDLEWLIQITCAAGYVDDVMALATRVDAAFYRWAPTITGLVCGPFRPPTGYQPPMLLDRDNTPHRPFVPLQYTARITAT